MARKLILVISGFTEHNHENTGSRELHEKLLRYEEMDSHDDMVLVWLKEWKSDWKQIAAQLTLWGFDEVFVCCYSWGAGYGLRTFAKHYKGKIKAVICDPVYRSIVLLFRWLAFCDMTIKYPKNVEVVAWFRQFMDEPGGDKVASPNPLPKPIPLPYPHTQIDNSPEYHAEAEKQVKLWLKPNEYVYN